MQPLHISALNQNLNKNEKYLVLVLHLFRSTETHKTKMILKSSKKSAFKISRNTA